MQTINGASAPIGLTIANHATGQPIVYIGQTTTLDVKLVNATGTNLAVGTNAQFIIYFPNFYTGADIANMKADLSAMPGWTGAIQSDSLMLSRPGGATTWPAGEALAFSISNMASASTQPVSDEDLLIDSTGVAGLPIPMEVGAALPLITAPQPGNLPLTEALHVSLDNQGIVYVSNADDPLANQLTLYLTNIGDEPLYNDPKTPRPTAPAPQIVIDFTYGSTSGALAPADKQDGSLGSAWNIHISVADSTGGAWVPADPTIPSTNATPSWTLTPAPTNAGVLGFGPRSSVVFTISNIVSFLVPGVTQMRLRCSHFTKNAGKAFDQTVYLLDIVKQYPPPTRGVVGFHSPLPFQEVNHPDTPITIPLRWTLTEVNTVRLLSSQPGAAATRTDYGTPPPALTYDKTDIKLPGVTRTATFLFALQAYDAADRYLNSLQFAAHIQANMFVDPADGAVYPVARVGRQFWMAANLARFGSGSFPSPGKAATYGRAYTGAAALPGPIDEWRLPTLADWQALFASFADSKAAYAALIAGGPSEFNAVLGGTCDGQGVFSNFGTDGQYWTATPDVSGQRIVNFSSHSSSVIALGSLDLASGAAVRYVRDAA
jgi:uncharacterized protein (TIGR02145 family)